MPNNARQLFDRHLTNLRERSIRERRPLTHLLLDLVSANALAIALLPEAKAEANLIEKYRTIYYEWLANEALDMAGNGSAELVEKRAKALISAAAREKANKRHSKPGGSRDRQAAIRAAWASGKYSTRDICAEQEAAGLELSFSTARRALRNTPDP